MHRVNKMPTIAWLLQTLKAFCYFLSDLLMPLPYCIDSTFESQAVRFSALPVYAPGRKKSAGQQSPFLLANANSS